MEREFIQVLMKMVTGRKQELQLLRIRVPDMTPGGGGVSGDSTLGQGLRRAQGVDWQSLGEVRHSRRKEGASLGCELSPPCQDVWRNQPG